MKKLLALFTLATSAGTGYATVNSGGWYTGIDAGNSYQNLNYNTSIFNVDTSGVNLDGYGWSPSLRGFAGYDFNKYMGVELGYQYILNSSISYPDGGTFITNASTIDASYIAYLPIGASKWSVFGRLGIAYNNINSSLEDNTFSASGSGLSEILGIGIRLAFVPNGTFNLQWISNGLLAPVGISGGGDNIGKWTAQSIMAGAAYHF